MRIVIAHAHWMDGRKRTLSRLLEQLSGQGDVSVFESFVPEHACIWASRVWECAANEGGAVILNDDVEVCPDFGEVVDAMIAAAPDAPALSLHASMPLALEAAKRGRRWVRSYRYSGPAVYLPEKTATSMLEFAERLPWVFRSRVNEDNVAMLWMWQHQSPFWIPIPSPAKHDVSTPSSLGYDGHPHRSCIVPWSDFPEAPITDPAFWAVTEPPQWIANDWYAPEHMQRVRSILMAGRCICAMCMEREGTVGSQNGTMICGRCLGNCVTAVAGAGR